MFRNTQFWQIGSVAPLVGAWIEIFLKGEKKYE